CDRGGAGFRERRWRGRTPGAWSPGCARWGFHAARRPASCSRQTPPGTTAGSTRWRRSLPLGRLGRLEGEDLVEQHLGSVPALADDPPDLPAADIDDARRHGADARLLRLRVVEVAG